MTSSLWYSIVCWFFLFCLLAIVFVIFVLTGPQDRGHDRASLLPLLLRCGHTFCSGCLGKLVKLQKTNITCPQCQVSDQCRNLYWCYKGTE